MLTCILTVIFEHLLQALRMVSRSDMDHAFREEESRYIMPYCGPAMQIPSLTFIPLDTPHLGLWG
jgi:hypothetical protein